MDLTGMGGGAISSRRGFEPPARSTKVDVLWNW
jgi:hypothetical protein